MSTALDAPRLTIDGQAVDSPERLGVIDPSTAEPFVTIPAATRAHLDTAVAAARAAFPGWRDTPLRALSVKKT